MRTHSPLTRIVTAAMSLCTLAFAYGSDTPANLRTMLREHLKNPEFGLDHKAEYVITDLAFIEPVLDQALKYIDTTKPLSPTQIERARTSAVTYYRLGLAKPDGLKALEALIAKRFASPVLTRSVSTGNPAGEQVELDFGWMVGPLVANTRYGIEPAGGGENFEGRAPSTRLLARLLTDATRAHPRAKRVSVTITYPRSRLGHSIRATYVRSGFPESRNGWVQLESKSAPASRPLYQVRVIAEDFSPYLEGRHSFYVDCAPAAAAARTPQSAKLTESQLQNCPG